MVVLAPMICFTEIKQCWPFLCNFLHCKHRWIGMFSDATECVVLFCHHLGFWHSGMINILSYHEPSPVLIRALPPDANASHSSLRQKLPAVQCPLQQSCSPAGDIHVTRWHEECCQHHGGAFSPSLLAQNWGCDQGPLTTQQQLHQPAMNTNEWQWAGFQLYLEITNFCGQCRVLGQKPSIGIPDLSSP